MIAPFYRLRIEPRGDIAGVRVQRYDCDHRKTILSGLALDFSRTKQFAADSIRINRLRTLRMHPDQAAVVALSGETGPGRSEIFEREAGVVSAKSGRPDRQRHLVSQSSLPCNFAVGRNRQV
jgi:hypothetical protein